MNLFSSCVNCSFADLQTVHYLPGNPPFKKFDFSHTFDQCVREVENPKQKEIGEIRITLDKRFCDTPKQPTCNFWPDADDIKMNKNKPLVYEVFDPNGISSEISQVECMEACDREPPSPTPSTPRPPPGFFKRGPHGALLIMTNFCIMPINTFIARFYKETFNIKQINGQKAWLWVMIWIL